MKKLPETRFLIINADDYGYFDGVSAGILEAARCGTVTATGILANGVNLDRNLQALSAVPHLDVGVHLNLTFGRPLSEHMRSQLAPWKGLFPKKYHLARAVLRRTVTVAAVMSEWRAQIERCLSFGLQVRFLNSHEHVHMLPPLFNAASKLAHEYGISHVRYPCADWQGRYTMSSAARNLIVASLGFLNRRNRTTMPVMLGLAESGQLSLRYLRYRLASLPPGGIYELMCHPGMYNPRDEIDPRLVAFHRWDQEKDLLCSDGLSQLLRRHEIRRIGYRHLRITDDRLEVVEVDV